VLQASIARYPARITLIDRQNIGALPSKMHDPRRRNNRHFAHSMLQ
jgi:hypothetical protein